MRVVHIVQEMLQLKMKKLASAAGDLLLKSAHEPVCQFQV